jgi:hypothetical protein
MRRGPAPDAGNQGIAGRPFGTRLRGGRILMLVLLSPALSNSTEASTMSRLIALIVMLCLAPAFAFAQTDTTRLEGRLKKIQKAKTIAVAYRTYAFPFSF